MNEYLLIGKPIQRPWSSHFGLVVFRLLQAVVLGSKSLHLKRLMDVPLC